MTARVFRSTDFGASVDDTTHAIIKRSLVTGYGDQAVTITRSGNVATVTTPSPHGLLKLAKVTIGGADQAAYNGTFSVTVTGLSTYTYPVAGSPASPATGTITARLDGAGWSMPYANEAFPKAAFKQGAGSNGFYLRLATGDTGYNNRIVGYEDMTDVDTGSNAFPLEAQVAGGLSFVRNPSGTTTGRTYIVVANEKFVLMHSNQAGTADSTAGQLFCFGDLESVKPGDAFGTIIIAGTSFSTSANLSYLLVSLPTTVQGGHYLARAHGQAGGAVQFGKVGSIGKGSTTMGGTGSLPYPNGPDNGIHIAPVGVVESGGFRGTIPGLWSPLHNRPLAHGDMFEGSGELAGKVFVALNIFSGAQVLFEISDTW